MQKEHKIIILVSSGESQLYKNLLTHKLFLNDGSFLHISEANREYQHLYILSDDKIKVGDWFHVENHIVPHQCLMVDSAITAENGLPYIKEKCKKIIATTNPDLLISEDYKMVRESNHMSKINKPLPQIPQNIVEAYVNKPFDNVMVDYYIKHDGRLNANSEVLPKVNEDGILDANLIEGEQYTKNNETTCMRSLEEEAYEWAFETNGHKWSNNDNSAGDNYGSFTAGANSKWVQVEKIKAQIEMLYTCIELTDTGIRNKANELEQQLKQLEDESEID